MWASKRTSFHSLCITCLWEMARSLWLLSAAHLNWLTWRVSLIKSPGWRKSLVKCERNKNCQTIDWSEFEFKHKLQCAAVQSSIHLFLHENDSLHFWNLSHLRTRSTTAVTRCGPSVAAATSAEPAAAGGRSGLVGRSGGRPASWLGLSPLRHWHNLAAGSD